MFDRKKALAEWRQRIVEREVIQEDNLDELETHLLEQVDELEAAGLHGEEAFLVATRRLGHIDKLCAEYQKVTPGRIDREQLQWMVLGCALYVFVDYLFRLVIPNPIWWSYGHFLVGGMAIVAVSSGLVYPKVSETWRGLWSRLATHWSPHLMILFGLAFAARLLTLWTTVKETRMLSTPELVRHVLSDCFYLVLLSILALSLGYLQQSIRRNALANGKEPGQSNNEVGLTS